MPTYLCDDGNAEIEITADSAEEAAQEYVDGGDWGDDSATSWVRVYVQEIDEDGDPVGARKGVKVTIEADEPDCSHNDGHDWRSPHSILGGLRENPGVRGSGGGVIIDEVCVRCGCGRHTDTWAQDPSDGTQGHRSVSYKPGEYTEAVQARIEAVDVTTAPQSDECGGGAWSTYVAEGLWGRWASVVVDHEADDAVTVEWHDSEAEARAQSARDADGLTEAAAPAE